MTDLIDLLAWTLDMGADEAIGDHPVDRFAAAARPSTPAPTAIRPVAAVPVSVGSGIEVARAAAAAADSLEALARAVADFDLCPLKRTATNTVFADGNSASGLMLIGEAPGADEDRIGRPFVGKAGQLLDRMLAAIGRDRDSAYITNVLFWRPPGNRNPTPAEIDLCKPFVLRHIALARPRAIVILGGVAAGALVPGSPGIMRLRGRWLTLEIPGLAEPVEALPMYHPAFLLRTPERKRETWVDLLQLKRKLITNPNEPE
jgi:DNA polymerase